MDKSPVRLRNHSRPFADQYDPVDVYAGYSGMVYGSTNIRGLSWKYD